MKDKAYSEALLVQYLLGNLTEEEQVKIEDRAFQDRQYLQDLLAVENDLIDEYVRGELSDPERRQFESRFLASAEGRRKVEFARTLTAVAPDFAVIEKDDRAAALPTPSTWQNALAVFLRALGPAAKFSMAAAALLIVIGGSWLIVDSRRLRGEIAELRAEQQTRERQQKDLQQQFDDERGRSQDLAASLQREKEQRERSQELTAELERRQGEAASQPSQPAIVSLALWPGVSRSGGSRPKLVLPQTARQARLQIGIDPEDQYKRFRVELRDQAGQQVWAEDNLSARPVRAGRTVVLNLPARLLGAGQYELALKGVTDDGRTEDVGFYYFAVLKK